MTINDQVEQVKTKFAAEIKAMAEKARAEGRASAGGATPGLDLAERMAERASALQEQSPRLTNLQAVRAAYAEAGIAL